MKRVGFLYEKVSTEEAILEGFINARKSKSGRRSCFEFEKNLGPELQKLYDELNNSTYKPKPYYKFHVYEPKKRDIYAPSFRDCVVQYAIYSIIVPIFDPTFIDQSFACRIGKGTHASADFVQKSLLGSDLHSYTLQLDIKKFFYSIDRSVLRTLLEKKIKDKKFVDLCMLFAEYNEPTGIPIGNLLSQIYALIYMNYMDHFITRELNPKYYCRYVDDFILFNLTREQALLYRERIKEKLKNLKLELSRSTIAHTRRGVNFCGFRTWKSKRFIRRHSIFKAKKAIKSGNLCSTISHLTHASKTCSMQHLLNYIKENNFDLYCQLPKVYHKRHHKNNKSGMRRIMYNQRHNLC